MKKALDYSAASTPQLEAWAKQPRNAEDARQIREELRTRGGNRNDTGTMSLFAQKPSPQSSPSGRGGRED